jgi:membrane protein DedA with SNARE-associated domain
VAGDRLDVGNRQIGAGQENRCGARTGDTVAVGAMDLVAAHRAEDSRLCCPPPTLSRQEDRVLAFIDQVVIPFLNSLYGAVGYLGVVVAMTIESAMVPLPSELILPYAGFLVSDTSQLEPLTHGPWAFWIVVVGATLGNTLGSLISYAIGAYGGRPFLERYGRYLLIRPHEIELADRFFADHGGATVFVGRLLPIIRTFISFPAGVARMPLGRFIVYSTVGALIWSTLLLYAGTVLGENWQDIRHALQPFDLLIAVGVVALVVLFVWWRLGTPGRPRRGNAAG